MPYRPESAALVTATIDMLGRKSQLVNLAMKRLVHLEMAIRSICYIKINYLVRYVIRSRIQVVIAVM